MNLTETWYLQSFDNQQQQWVTDNFVKPQRLTAHQVSQYHQRLYLVSSFPVIAQPIKQVLQHKTKSKSDYLNKSLDTQIPKDTDACPTKENTAMNHTGPSELQPHKGGKVNKF